ncbi:MAG: hypothetical protein QF510_06260, partial [Rhodospirillales bacterium]|nr:hypothetical protein [Rhodospirillales bacterium]
PVGIVFLLAGVLPKNNDRDALTPCLCGGPNPLHGAVRDALGDPPWGKFEMRHAAAVEGQQVAHCGAVGHGHVRGRRERFRDEGPHKVTGA